MSDSRLEIEQLVETISFKESELDEAEGRVHELTEEIDKAKQDLRALQSDDLDEDLFDMIEDYGR